MKELSIFILAGGFGTRLKSVVSNVPKPMAPINNQPFLKYQIELIRKYFPNNKIYLLTYYLSEVIEDYFKNDSSIVIIKEKKPLGTGGSIKNAIDYLKLRFTDSVMVLNGDTFIKPNFIDMINELNNDVTIIGSLQSNCDRYGVLKLRNNMVTDFLEKEVGIKNAYINAGCYFFKQLHFFDKIKESKFNVEDKFKNYLLTSKIGIFKYHSIFIDIGIPEDYEKMKKYMSKNNYE